MSDQDKLFSFEKEIDDRIDRSGMFQLPLRSVLTNLFGGIDFLIEGERFKQGISRRRTEGEGLGSRLSYLVPFLKNCTLEIGESAIDALSATAQCIEEFEQIVSYAHFCELMPEVRRNYYEVRKTVEGFELLHPDEQFSRAEEYDILLTELSLPFHIGEFPDLRLEFIALARQLPILNLVIFFEVLAELFQCRLNSIREVPLLEPSAFQISVGIRWDEFCRIRAALSAYADCSIGLANALELLWLNEKDSMRKKLLSNEFFEWIAVFNTKNFFVGSLMALTGVGNSAIERVLSFFSINVENQNFENAGEGYFPPLIDYSHSYLFSPHILLSMLSTRNILYVLNKRDSTRFDNIVSHYLEPTLLKQASEILKRISDLRIISNQKWSNGEFDLLVYQLSSNTVLHIQAKAPIPPQGARMTKAVENRSKEGIKQLNRFQNLPQDERDAVLSGILKISVEKAQCVSVLLCRSGLGTYSAWKLAEDIAVLNLQLLNGVVQILLSKGLDLSEFKAVTASLLTDVHNKSVLEWEQGNIFLNGILIRVPLLRLNYSEIRKITKRLSPV